MRRFSFWPAALVSSLCFAGLHVFGAAHAAGIPLLLSMMLVFGLLQCVLVRRSGRIGPAIGVHATMNLLVMVLAVTGGS
jgi:membrane protease YdiL (CAAX protease family)